MALKEFDIIQVDWVDCEKEDDWFEYPPLIVELPVMRTIGFFYKKTEAAIVLSQTIDKKVFSGGTGLVEGTFTIPLSAIKKIKIIKTNK